MKPLPDLRELHRRHSGLTPAIAVAYAEAAGICLSKHHHSPAPISIDLPRGTERWLASWSSPSAREERAWANDIDRIEAGAYSMALSATEGCLGLIALARAETLTGADYYVGSADDDFETARRLEVSGVDLGAKDVLRRRVAKKTRQAREGMSLDAQGNSTGILFFNTRRSSLADSAVRRAIASSLNIDAIVEYAHEKNPNAFVATHLLPPALRRHLRVGVGHAPAPTGVLDSAGATSVHFEMLVPWAHRPYMPRPLSVAHEIQRQLNSVGVNVDVVQARTSEEFFDRLVRREFDMALAGWIADSSAPADFFEALLWSRMDEGDHCSNHSGWKSGDMDSALFHFRNAPTDANLREIEKLLLEDMPLVPLMYGGPVGPPALVCVVGFEAAAIIIEDVEP